MNSGAVLTAALCPGYTDVKRREASRMRLGCVVMAAGASRRFGENKLLKTFGGVPLYRRALEAVPESEFDMVCVVTGSKEVAELAASRGFRTACNDRPELGVSRTIRLGLEGMTQMDGVLFMTADQPLLTADTLRRLAEAFRQAPQCIWAAAANGVRGNPCLFPRTLFGELTKLEGDTGGGAVIRAHRDWLRLVETPAWELADCDTVQALRDLEKNFGKEQKL